MGKYKHGKPDALLDLAYLTDRFKNGSYWLHKLAYQSYATLLFYVGCRRSEPLPPVTRTRYVYQLYIEKIHGPLNQYKRQKTVGKREQVYVYVKQRYTPQTGVRKNDVHIKGKSLFIQVPALKGGVRDKPNELFLEWPFVNLIAKQVERIRGANRWVWNFSPETAYNIITHNFPGKTPHWFRHNRVTRLRVLRDKAIISTDDIKAVTGIQSDSTLEGYGMKTEEGIRKVAEAMAQQME